MRSPVLPELPLLPPWLPSVCEVLQRHAHLPSHLVAADAVELVHAVQLQGNNGSRLAITRLQSDQGTIIRVTLLHWRTHPC